MQLLGYSLKKTQIPNSIIEQGLNSLTNFLLNFIALHTLAAKDVGPYFFLLCGTQIAIATLSAKLITPELRVSENRTICTWDVYDGLLHSGLCALIINIICQIYLTIKSSQASTAQMALGICFSILSIVLEVIRRKICSLSPEHVKAHKRLHISSTVKCGITIILSIILFKENISLETFFCAVTSIFCIAFFILIYKIEKGTPPLYTAYKSANWFEVLGEAYTTLAWPNIPIFILAALQNPSSLSFLAACRTPVSFLNPAIEFIEVYRRRKDDSQILSSETIRRYIFIWALLTPAVAVLAYFYKFLIRDLSELKGSYELFVALFWWIQLSATFDRMSHNQVRRVGSIKTKIEILSQLAPIPLTACAIYLFHTPGCIISMLLWSSANTIFRSAFKEDKHGTS